jgi:hypothetical protein
METDPFLDDREEVLGGVRMLRDQVEAPLLGSAELAVTERGREVAFVLGARRSDIAERGCLSGS